MPVTVTPAAQSVTVSGAGSVTVADVAETVLTIDGEAVTVEQQVQTVEVAAAQAVAVAGSGVGSVTVAAPGPQGASSVANAFDVTDIAYGAVGDGTTNDAAAIQAAIDAATAAYVATGTKQTVLVPSGARCKLVVTASTLTASDNNVYKAAVFMKSGVHLQVDGDLYLPFTGDPATFGNWQVAVGAAASVSDWRISGSGTIDGGNTGTATEAIHSGVFVSGSSKWRVKDLHFTGFQGDSIRADRAGSAGTRPTRFQIVGNEIELGTGQAIEVNGGQRFTVSGNVIDTNSNFATGGGAEAIWLNGDKWTCRGNVANDWGTGISIGVASSGFTVAANEFDDDIVWSAAISNGSFTGNVCSDLHGLSSGTESNITISANTVTDAIQVLSAGGKVAITGNTATTVYVIAGTGQITVAGNTASAFDIRVKATVSGNTAQSMTLTGAKTTATGNTIESTTGDALTVGATEIHVSGGRITTTSAGNHAIKAVASSTIDNSYFHGIIIQAPIGGGSGAFRLDTAASSTGTTQVDNKITGSLFGIA